MNHRILGIFALLMLVSTESAHAQNLVLNPSFETGAYVPLSGTHNAMSLPVGSSFMDSWEIIVDEVAWIDNANNFAGGLPIASPYGNKYLDLGGQFDIPPFGGVRQTIVTTPGQLYNLAFSLGTYEGIAGTSSPVTVQVSINGSLLNFTANAPGGTVGNYWQDFGQSFTATTAATVISFVGQPPHQFHLGFDNVSVVAASAPEPTTFGLLVLGLSGGIYSARRYRRGSTRKK